MAKVPLAKASNSKTPMGPFQMTVLQSESAAEISLVANSSEFVAIMKRAAVVVEPSGHHQGSFARPAVARSIN